MKHVVGASVLALAFAGSNVLAAQTYVCMNNGAAVENTTETACKAAGGTWQAVSNPAEAANTNPAATPNAKTTTMTDTKKDAKVKGASHKGHENKKDVKKPEPTPAGH